MTIDRKDLEREAKRWAQAAHEAVLDDDSSIPLWRAAAARAARDLELYKAGWRGCERSHMPVQKWAEAHGWKEDG